MSTIVEVEDVAKSLLASHIQDKESDGYTIEKVFNLGGSAKVIVSKVGCPSITLLDLDWDGGPEYFIFENGSGVSIGAQDSNSGTGGLPPYTLTSSDLPSTMTLAYNEGKLFWQISDTDSTPVGFYTFTIEGTDANDCPITPREYTIEVQNP